MSAAQVKDGIVGDGLIHANTFYACGDYYGWLVTCSLGVVADDEVANVVSICVGSVCYRRCGGWINLSANIDAPYKS